MLTMVHNNRAYVENNVFSVDRKFHLGMEAYARGVRSPILSIQPENKLGSPIMDRIEVPCAELAYSVMTVKTDNAMRPLNNERERLRDVVLRSRLVYGGGLGTAEMAARAGVPYILTREYDLQTEIRVATSQVSSSLRRAIRALKSTFRYASGIPVMSRAAQLHCNGYPIFDATKWFNNKRLLYLDSRMSADMVIPEAELVSRFSSRARRPLRLLYSGRYEPIKGADDAIRVARACVTRGLDVEMHCYGQGSLRDEMRRLAAETTARGRIHVHDAVSFPELVELARTFDIFVCCHVQSDPSCTYLESLGSGLPIVGYGNRMWSRLCQESRAGLSTPMNRPEVVAACVQTLAADGQALDAMSLRARTFAADHTFEREFAKRIDAINLALDAK